MGTGIFINNLVSGCLKHCLCVVIGGGDDKPLSAINDQPFINGLFFH